MIIPIGHEQDTVRRLPWVTFGLMAACVVAFVAVNVAGDAPVDGGADPGDPLRFYLQHPYLELDPGIESLLAERFGEQRYRQLFEVIQGAAIEPPDDETRLREQHRLDGMCRAVLERVHQHPYRRFGLVPDDPSPLSFLTHMFLHGGVLHLLGNLLILYLAGPFVEDVWGRPIYLGFYLASGLAAAVLHVAVQPGSTVPLIGASGAIAGVMGAFLIRYARTRIRFYYVFGLLWRGTFDAAAWIMLPLWFGEQLFLGMATFGVEGGGVAYWAHVGGFGFGIAGALGLRRFGIEERVTEAVESRLVAEAVDRPRVEEALRLGATGEPDRALAILAEETGKHPKDIDAALAFWSLAVEHQRAAEAAGAMLHVVREEIRAGDVDLALAHWSELSAHVPDVLAEPDLLIRLARVLRDEGQPARAAAAIRGALLAGGAAMPSATALRIARAAAGLEPGIRRTAARIALGRGDLGPAERRQAEELLA